MKKLFSIILTVCIILSVCTLPALAEDSIKVTVDGKVVDCAAYGQEPIAINGTTLVPLRSVFEALGAAVMWDGDTQSVVSFRDDVSVLLVLNSKEMIVNGEVKTLSVPAQSMNNRTMVPVRAIAEAFGCDVKWDGDTRTVIVLTTIAGENPEDIVAKALDATFSLDFDEASKYFKDPEMAEATYGSFDIDQYMYEMTGSTDVDPRLKAIFYDYMKEAMGLCTYKIDNVVIEGDTAMVEATIVSPDFNNISTDGYFTEDEIIENALAKCGMTVEQLENSTDPADFEEFALAVFEATFEAFGKALKTEAQNGKVISEKGITSLEKINGKWLIVEEK